MKTMGAIVLHFELKGDVGFLLAYLIKQHDNIACISSDYSIYLNHDEDMIAKAPIIDTRPDLMMTQNSLDRVFLLPM